jgi:hypothetical protein
MLAHSKLKCHSYPNMQNESYVSSHGIYPLSLSLSPRNSQVDVAEAEKCMGNIRSHRILAQILITDLTSPHRGRICTFGCCLWSASRKSRLHVQSGTRELYLFFSLNRLALLYVSSIDIFKGGNISKGEIH